MVAFGRVFPTKDGDTLHTIVIGKGFARVCIDQVRDGYEELRLPVPTSEMETMISALGSFVLWPRKDIVVNITNQASTHLQPTTLTPQIKEPTTVAAKTRALVGMQTPTSKIGLPAVEAKGTHTPVDMPTPKELLSAQTPLPRRKQIKFHQCLQLLYKLPRVNPLKIQHPHQCDQDHSPC